MNPINDDTGFDKAFVWKPDETGDLTFFGGGTTQLYQAEEGEEAGIILNYGTCGLDVAVPHKLASFECYFTCIDENVSNLQKLKFNFYDEDKNLLYSLPLEGLTDYLSVHNKITFRTHIEANQLRIVLNDVYVNELVLNECFNTNKFVYFMICNVPDDGSSLKVILNKFITRYFKEDVICTLTNTTGTNQLQAGSPNRFFKYGINVVSEYGRPVTDRVKINCTNLDYVTPRRGDNGVDDTLYMLYKENSTDNFWYSELDNEGNTYVRVHDFGENDENNSMLSARFQIQALYKENNFLKQHQSDSSTCYFKATPTIDLDNVPSELFYSENEPFIIEPIIIDDHGDTLNNFNGSLWIDNEIYCVWNGGNLSYTNVPPFENESITHNFKLIFEENALLYETYASKDVIFKKARLSVTTTLLPQYAYPNPIVFDYTCTCDNENISIPDIAIFRNPNSTNTHIIPVGNTITDTADEGDSYYVYRFLFDGTSEILPLDVDFLTVYNIPLCKLVEISNSQEAYVGQVNTLVLNLIDENGVILSERDVNFVLTIHNSNGGTATKNYVRHTNDDGNVTFSYRYNNTNNQVSAFADIVATFDGDNEYGSCSLESSFRWLAKTVPQLSGNITNQVIEYPAPIKIKGKVRGDSSQKIVKLYRNGEYISEQTVENDTYFNFEDTPPANLANDETDNYTYTLVCEETETSARQETVVGTIRYLNKSYLNTNPSDEITVECLTSKKIVVALTDNVGVLYNKTINVDITCVTEEGLLYELDDKIAHQTVITTENGTYFNFTGPIAGEYTIRFSFAGETHLTPSETILNITCTKIQTQFKIISVQEKLLKVFQTGKVTVELTNKNTGEVISNKNITLTLPVHDFNGNLIKTICTDKPLTTKSNGRCTSQYTETKQGFVTGTFIYKCVEDNVYTSTEISETIEWYKINTEFVLINATDTTEVTLNGSVTVKLIDEYSNVLPNKEVNSLINFTNFSNQSVEVYGNDETGLKTTNSNGEVTAEYIPLNLGDVYGKFTIAHAEDDIYLSTSIDKTVTWNKIETIIKPDDVKIYSGRYTNLNYGEPDWTTTSPGVSENYYNFHAKLLTVNTETSYFTVPDGTVTFKMLTNKDSCVSTTTDDDGNVYARWTKDYDNYYSFEAQAIFKATPLFKACTVPFNFTVLERVPVTITPYFDIIYDGHETPRYNIPFNIRAVLKCDNLRFSEASVNIYFNNELIKTLITDITGTVVVYKYRPQVVGDIPVKIEYDPNDLIDKYISSTLNVSCMVDKDYPYLNYLNLPIRYTSNCNNKQNTVKVGFYNSIDEKIKSPEIIEWYENFGDSKNGENWEIPEEAPSTTTLNTNGESNHIFNSWSKIKLIKTIFNETWRYYSTNKISYIQYDILTLYGFNNEDVLNGKTAKTIGGTQVLNPVEGGYANIDLGCKLAEGLYDIHIEYMGEISDGCQKYANGELYKGIRKKQTSSFDIDTTSPQYNENTGRYEEEAKKQFNVPVILQNKDKNEPITNAIIKTTVDKKQALTQKSDETGKVTRNWVNPSVDDEDTYLFTYPQTRKIASCTKIAYGYTLPMTPLFSYVDDDRTEWTARKKNGTIHYYKKTTADSTFTEISENAYNNGITCFNYEYNEFPMSVKAYHIMALYDATGNEIKIDPNTNKNVKISYDDEGNETIVTVNEDGSLSSNSINKNYFNNTCVSHEILTIIPYTNLTWRDGEGTKITTTTTDRNGLSTCSVYYNVLAEENNEIKVHIEGYEEWAPTPYQKILLDTHERLTTKLTTTVQDGSLTYDILGKINCKLTYFDINDVEHPLPNKTVRFRGVPVYDNSLTVDTSERNDILVTTDSNGYCEIPYVPLRRDVNNPCKFQCLFRTDGIYFKTDEVFQFVPAKQTPELTVTLKSSYDNNGTNNKVRYGEPIYLTAELNRNKNSYTRQTSTTSTLLKKQLNAYAYNNSLTTPVLIGKNDPSTSFFSDITAYLTLNPGDYDIIVKFEDNNDSQFNTCESNVVNGDSSYKLKVDKGLLKLYIKTLASSVYSDLRKQTQTDEYGIKFNLIAHNYNNQPFAKMPCNLDFRVNSGSLYNYDSSEAKLVVSPETFSILKDTTLPKTFYASSGIVWNADDSVTRKVTATVYGNSMFIVPDGGLKSSAIVEGDDEIKLLERNTYLTSELYSTYLENGEIKQVLVNSADGIYTFASHENITVKGTLKFKAVKNDWDYSHDGVNAWSYENLSDDKLVNITGTNFPRQFLESYENKYASLKKIEDIEDDELSARFNSFLRGTLYPTYNLPIPEPLVPCNLVRLSIDDGSENDTGTQMAVYNGLFEYTINTLSEIGLTESKTVKFNIDYGKTQSLKYKGVSSPIEQLAVTKTNLMIEITGRNGKTINGKLYWYDGRGKRHLFETDEGTNKILKIFNRKNSSGGLYHEVTDTNSGNVSPDGTFTLTATESRNGNYYYIQILSKINNNDIYIGHEYSDNGNTLKLLR